MWIENTGVEISWVKCPYEIQVREVGSIKPVGRTGRPYGEQVEHDLLDAFAVSPHHGRHARVTHAEHLHSLVQRRRDDRVQRVLNRSGGSLRISTRPMLNLPPPSHVHMSIHAGGVSCFNLVSSACSQYLPSG